jgi:hypothetical protein
MVHGWCATDSCSRQPRQVATRDAPEVVVAEVTGANRNATKVNRAPLHSVSDDDSTN